MQAKAAVLEHISVHGMLAVPHEHLRAALDLPPSSSLANPERTMALKKVNGGGSSVQWCAAAGQAMVRQHHCTVHSCRCLHALSPAARVSIRYVSSTYVCWWVPAFPLFCDCHILRHVPPSAAALPLLVAAALPLLASFSS